MTIAEQEIVSKISPYAIPGIKLRERLTLRAIEQIVCKRLDVDREAMHTKTRQRKFAFSRQLVFYLAARNIKRMSVNENTIIAIGYFYRRNHATVLHSVKTIRNEMETNSRVRAICEELGKSIDYMFL